MKETANERIERIIRPDIDRTYQLGYRHGRTMGFIYGIVFMVILIVIVKLTST